LTSAVNALPGSPNATTIGQPNGTPLKRHRFLKLVVACKCPQYLPGKPNATVYGLFNDVLKYSASTTLAFPMHSKCINVLSSWPNTTASGQLN
ncbi:uncharacterized protein SCHCODRAFT_02462362, partial [Schizophyllum commune H4-8]|uniref:uncharacterized protein n=1 Tax=Schizophyllum commune (strain H4-8 / FGSC 9210) TaxID=578458 RepID=UPI00215F322C